MDLLITAIGVVLEVSWHRRLLVIVIFVHGSEHTGRFRCAGGLAGTGIPRAVSVLYAVLERVTRRTGCWGSRSLLNLEFEKLLRFRWLRVRYEYDTAGRLGLC